MAGENGQERLSSMRGLSVVADDWLCRMANSNEVRPKCLQGRIDGWFH